MPSSARLVLMETMLENVKSSRFPSREVMDKVEKMLRTPDEATSYLGVLMEKLTEVQYPSMELFDRAMRVARAIEYATEDA
jgi:hypothetical protein